MPVTTLNNVVLPAPFGPIKPKISPARTRSVTSERALSPPKRFSTRCTHSNASASDIGAFGAGRFACCGKLAAPDRRRPEPGRPEQHHEHERESKQQHAQIGRIDVNGAEERLLQGAGVP